MKRFFYVALLAGCASRAPEPPTLPVRAIAAEKTANCTYVDTLVGASSWYGAFAERGIEKAKASVLEKAAAAGATAVVWGPPSLTYGSTSISAQAYRCPP